MAEVATRFGVATEQVLRDHVISHALAALARLQIADALVFLGGTALSRTFLPDLRLSEDIDLLTARPRAQMAAAIEHALDRGLLRSHGRPVWEPRLVETSGAEAATLVVGGRLRVRVQLLSAEAYPSWPTERRDLVQRYRDAPPATLRTLTAAAFAASKAVAWVDRRAPRDLYDLWGLGRCGHLTHDAAALFRRLGPTGEAPRPWMFAEAPPEPMWIDALGHQCRLERSAADALAEVRAMWGVA